MTFSIADHYRNGNEAKILIEGDLLVKDSQELKAELLRLLENHNTAKIYLQNIHRIDLSALQLLFAFQKSALVRGKSFQFFRDDSSYLQNILALSGFTELINAE